MLTVAHGFIRSHYTNSLHFEVHIVLNNTVTILGCDYRRGMDWILDFLSLVYIIRNYNYNTIAGFHTTNHSTLSLLILFSLVVAW
jgi:hypothetical protein